MDGVAAASFVDLTTVDGPHGVPLDRMIRVPHCFLKRFQCLKMGFDPKPGFGLCPVPDLLSGDAPKLGCVAIGIPPHLRGIADDSASGRSMTAIPKFRIERP